MPGRILSYAAGARLLKRRHVALWQLVAPALFAVIVGVGRGLPLDGPIGPGLWAIALAVALLESMGILAAARSGVWRIGSVVSITEDGIEQKKGRRAQRMAFADIRRIVAVEGAARKTSSLEIIGTNGSMLIAGLEDMDDIRTSIRIYLPLDFKVEVAAASGTDWDDCLMVCSVILAVWSLLFASFLALKEGAPNAYRYTTAAVPVVSALWLLWTGRKWGGRAAELLKRDETRDGALVFCFSTIWLLIELLC